MPPVAEQTAGSTKVQLPPGWQQAIGSGQVTLAQLVPMPCETPPLIWQSIWLKSVQLPSPKQHARVGSGQFTAALRYKARRVQQSDATSGHGLDQRALEDWRPEMHTARSSVSSILKALDAPR